jgi:hypothetical protein
MVDLLNTPVIIEGQYKNYKTLESMKYRSHEVIHMEKEEYDTWPNQMVTSVKVDMTHKDCKSQKSR